MMFLTKNPEHSLRPDDPEMVRVLAPQTVAAVWEALDTWDWTSGNTLTAEQRKAVLDTAEAWLQRRDQEFMDLVFNTADQVWQQSDSRPVGKPIAPAIDDPLR